MDADADFIAALVVLEDLVRGREVKRRPLHVLGAVHFPDTVQVANYLIGSLGESYGRVCVWFCAGWLTSCYVGLSWVGVGWTCRFRQLVEPSRAELIG